MTEVAVQDQLAVGAVLARYCHRCDDGDFAGLVALFTADGEFAYGGQTLRGPAEMIAFFERTQGRPEQRGMHLMVNTVLEPAGADRVRSTADFVFLRYTDDRLAPAMAGRYLDDLVQVDGAWRIARREARLLDQPPSP
ncbi:nuclear transport factor 2 family protein [Frankia sp. AgB32]|uniref:nuclear transport factor 2 family protein n=1 Tax=Frankia sp. AgB32 TaxID=631119 RepID=UPI00200E062B|nr:nuclear transport factor 2 family protein [Frankia sp. AgB32]MCK9897789.1 nuclear transport factor 2 family protein [Frankia sp. AgB32]